MKITNDNNLSKWYEKEWLITNGIGGYSMSTISGMNTRKYHALLVAAIGENFERYVVLPKINEEIEINKGTYSFSSNECPNYMENGFKYEKAFVKEYLPEFFYQVQDVDILKKIAMVHGENKAAITYTIKTNKNGAKLRLSPLINYRNFHEIKNVFFFSQEVENDTVKIILNSKNNLYIKVSDSSYSTYHNTYYQNMLYRKEKERGFEHTENHFMPGIFEIEVLPNEEKTIEVVASVNDALGFNMKANAQQIIKNEETRLQKWCKIGNANTEIQKELIISADSFIIEKSYGKTIIAGYPWFSDWGRDTFISMEGVLLKTNRFNDAKSILKTFLKHIKEGLIPNLIGENGGQSYNSVDAPLWLINAVYQYYQYTNDIEFVKDSYQKLQEIIDSYKNGTQFNIKMDEDGLIMAGDEKTQLTWMDAKVGDYIPTPRYGKAVEINALWYNALNIMRVFSERLEEEFDLSLISKVKESFKKFNNEKQGLYDTIEPLNTQLRPNQLFAVSLPFPVVDTEKANEVLQLIEDKLLTEKGLKTLNSEDDKYCSRYEGDAIKRDSSYHQGTVWPWLLIAYFESCYRLSRKPKLAVNLEELLQDQCIGSICEIYDADEPRRPNGCPAQAWSIAMGIMLEK